MLTQIVCPNCGQSGAATAASLPRVLICSQCGHGAFIKSGRPARSPSVTRDERRPCARPGSGTSRRPILVQARCEAWGYRGGGHLKITHQRACYAVEFQMTATVETQLGRTQAEATQRLLADATAKRPWWRGLAG